MNVLNVFVNENDLLVREVCGLNELGYPLALTQADLTLDQKTFLFFAYKRYRELEKEASKTGNIGKSSPSERNAWKERNKKLILDKRSKTDEQRFRGNLRPGGQS